MSILERVPLAESPDEQTSEMKRIVVSSIVGTAVEWYDFLIYGTASALVFNKLFLWRPGRPQGHARDDDRHYGTWHLLDRPPAYL
jgi:hypothetical protein